MWVGYYPVLGVELNNSPDLSTLGGSGLGTRLHIHCYGYVSPANVRPIGGICRWNCDYGCLEKFCQAATSIRYVSICFPAASYLFCFRGCNRVLSSKTRSKYCVQTCTLALCVSKHELAPFQLILGPIIFPETIWLPRGHF